MEEAFFMNQLSAPARRGPHAPQMLSKPQRNDKSYPHAKHQVQRRLRASENRAFEANIRENHPDNGFFYERNDGHERLFCHDANYNPDEVRPFNGREVWRRWQFVYTGNARVPCWVVRVPNEIIWGHGGLWSDNSVAMLAALFRIHFPLTAEGKVAPPNQLS
jgi:hypothetical protein